MPMKILTQNEVKFVSGGSSGQKGDDPKIASTAIPLQQFTQQGTEILTSDFAQDNKEVSP